MAYRQQWPKPPEDPGIHRLLDALSSFADQQGKLAKEWDKISRVWSLVAAMFLLLAALFALSFCLQLGLL